MSGKIYVDEMRHASHVIRCDGDRVVVSHLNPGKALITAEVKDSGNGFIVCFPAVHSTQQDHYVCLDYSQARDLVLGLAEFKHALGFIED